MPTATAASAESKIAEQRKLTGKEEAILNDKYVGIDHFVMSKCCPTHPTISAGKKGRICFSCKSLQE